MEDIACISRYIAQHLKFYNFMYGMDLYNNLRTLWGIPKDLHFNFIAIA